MATLTINSAGFPGPDEIFLPLDLTFTGNATSIKQFVSITDLIGPGTGNVQNYTLPPGFTIVQPLPWNDNNYTNPPDEIEINSITLNLGTGATGTLFYTETDGLTPAVTPLVIPVGGPGPVQQVYIGVDGFTNGTTPTVIVINVTLRDTISGDSFTTDCFIRFVNEPAEIVFIEDIIDTCQSLRRFDVVVPTGGTKHISTVRSSAAATPLLNEIINSTTQYELIILGANDVAPFNFNDNITLYVRDGGPTGPIEDSISISRIHNGNLCVP